MKYYITKRIILERTEISSLTDLPITGRREAYVTEDCKLSKKKVYVSLDFVKKFLGDDYMQFVKNHKGHFELFQEDQGLEEIIKGVREENVEVDGEIEATINGVKMKKVLSRVKSKYGMDYQLGLFIGHTYLESQGHLQPGAFMIMEDKVRRLYDYNNPYRE